MFKLYSLGMVYSAYREEKNHILEWISEIIDALLLNMQLQVNNLLYVYTVKR